MAFKLTDVQKTQIWRHSIPLRKAPIYFAEPAKKKRYDLAQSKSVKNVVQAAIDDATARKIVGVEAITSIFAEPQRIMSERLDVTRELQADVTTWFSNDLLRATGFQPPRRIEDIPAVLPHGFWQGQINWDHSEVSFQSMNFLEVRVTTKTIWDRIKDQFSYQPASVGRPSIQSVLLISIRELVKEGNVDVRRSMSSHFPLIRKSVEVHAKKQKMKKTTISDEAIRKAFSPLFNGLKGGKKQ